MDRLSSSISQDALHDSAERINPPRCYPGTQATLLLNVTAWLENHEKSKPFLWIYGPAGDGKSAIAQTLAETFAAAGRLAGSFFFNRISAVSHDKGFISTLASQLILQFPQIRQFVLEAISYDPLVFDRSLQAQLQALILQPLTQAVTGDAQLLESRPTSIIIVDGLDECIDPGQQRSILKTLSEAITQFSLPLSFLIVSRPEASIRNTFDEEPLLSLSDRIDLDEFRSDMNIRLFLESQFQNIRNHHPMKGYLPTPWPSPSDMEYLITKSNQQFIYAAIIMKYLGSLRHSPMARLTDVLGKSPPPQHIFDELDALYSQILSSANDFNLVRQILMVVLLATSPHRPTVQFVESSLSLAPGAVHIALIDLHSVLYIPEDHDGELRVYHTSFSEFLLDSARSGQFFIDINSTPSVLSGSLQHQDPSKVLGSDPSQKGDVDSNNKDPKLDAVVPDPPKVPVSGAAHERDDENLGAVYYPFFSYAPSVTI
jgi:hypothetical protein